MGAAIAWRVSRRYPRVALIEQYDQHHELGSSHGNSRIFRLTYRSTDYVHLARQARKGWLEASEEIGHELLKSTGAVDIGPSSQLDELASVLSQAGADYQRLDEPNDRFALFRLPNGWQLLFQPDGGVLWARRSLNAFCTLAAANGAEVATNSRVISLARDGDSIHLETDRGTYLALTH